MKNLTSYSFAAVAALSLFAVGENAKAELITLYEDAEDIGTSGWKVFDNDPALASIDNIFDDTANSNVIQLNGAGVSNAYSIGGFTAATGWNNQSQFLLSWRMKFADNFTIYVRVDTLNGARYLSYNNSNTDGLLNGSTVHHGLGPDSSSDQWLYFSRDLEQDLLDAEPDNSLISVYGIIIRGSGLIDDISLASNTNSPPVANAGEDQNVVLGQSFTLDASASLDSDGTISNYVWLDQSGNIVSNSALATLTASEALNTFVLNVTDNNESTSSDLIQINASDSDSVLLDDYELAFSDEFSDAILNNSKWNTALLWGPYLPTNNEQQLYVDTLGMHADFDHTPFKFNGNSLKITATPTTSTLLPPVRPPSDSPLWQPNSYSEYNQNYPSGISGENGYNEGYQDSEVKYLSGIITSYGSFSMTHGYVEMRAKLPAGQGLWPAFWLLPQHYVKDVPEIDVMEFLGQDVGTLYHTYHYFDIEDNWNLISTPSYPSLTEDWTVDFHTFGMAWSPTEIVWYVDGDETKRITDNEFLIPNQPMHLLANLAVGGNWPGEADETTPFPAIFEIDYIRAYKKKLATELDLASDYQLMFDDDFNAETLDASKWNTHFLWGPYLPINNEEQYYVDALGADAGGLSPFTIDNGVLSITARTNDDPLGFPIPQTLPSTDNTVWSEFETFQRNLSYTPQNYTSGILTSYDAFKFAHGYAEVRAKIPKGAGQWPAFWLLNGYYVSQQPEIDIMEVRGENPGEIIHSYHHFEDGELESESFSTQHSDSADGYSTDFHTYGVRWQPGKIDWYIDGDLKHTFEDESVGYQVMYVIVNLAVGGNFNYSAVDTSLLPSSLDIDYIRVYQEKGID